MKTSAVGPASDFHYINQGDCLELDGVDDSVSFEATCDALSLLSVASDQQRAIFRVLAAVLHMGNIQFLEKSRRSDDAVIKVGVNMSLRWGGWQHFNSDL